MCAGIVSETPRVLLNWLLVREVPTSGQVLMVWKLRFCLVFVSAMCLFHVNLLSLRTLTMQVQGIAAAYIALYIIWSYFHDIPTAGPCTVELTKGHEILIFFIPPGSLQIQSVGVPTFQRKNIKLDVQFFFS